MAFWSLREDSGQKVGNDLATALALDLVTVSLRNRGIKGSLVAVKDRLFWRCTATGPDGVRKSRRVPLGLPANPGQLIEAESRIVSLAAEIGRWGILPNPLPWASETRKSSGSGQAQGATRALTVSEALTKLEADFWQGKVRTGAAERTWDRVKAEVSRLPAKASLTMDLLVAVASSTVPGSRTRLEACKVFKRLAKLVKLGETERLDAIRTPYEPGQRDLPSDDEITAMLLRLDPAHKYSWITWALVTYGCRPSEVYSLRPADDGTAKVLTVKRKGKHPIWRTAMALTLVEPWGARSVPWDVSRPAQYDSLEAQRVTAAWGKWLGSQVPGMQLYDIRHCWAIRSIRESVPTGLAARCMGHDIAVHTRTYHRWLEQSDVAAFVAKRGVAARMQERGPIQAC